MATAHSIQKRFWAKVRKADGCWVWTASKTAKGYGYFHIDKRQIYAHRFSYELAHGSIPPGRQIDHVCRNRACVNPSHLEAVTSRENTLRGDGVSAVHSRKTHCIHGHRLTPENTYVYRGGRERKCKTCLKSTA